MLITLLFKDPRLFFTIMLLVVFSVCCHEFVHAFTALKFGDPTAADRGHLTLNPFKQMGIFSLIMLCIIGIAWGQVPVNRANLRGKFAPAAVAFSGPLTNIVLSILFATAGFACFFVLRKESFASMMLTYGAALNLILAFINLLPFPGFDGYEVLTALRGKPFTLKSEFAKGATYLCVLLLFYFFDRLFSAAGYLIGCYMRLLVKIFFGGGQ